MFWRPAVQVRFGSRGTALPSGIGTCLATLNTPFNRIILWTLKAQESLLPLLPASHLREGVMADDSTSEKTREGTPPEEDFNEADQDDELTEDEATQAGPVYDSEEELGVRWCWIGRGGWGERLGPWRCQRAGLCALVWTR